MMETDEMHTMNSAELAAAVNDPSEVKSDHVSDDASMANFLLYEKPLLPGKGVLYVAHRRRRRSSSRRSKHFLRPSSPGTSLNSA